MNIYVGNLPYSVRDQDLMTLFSEHGTVSSAKVIIDREVNRHAAFGLGIHRCLGSNLARLELRVAVEEFLAAYPDFELAPGEIVKWCVGQIRGPRELPVRITTRAN